MDLCFRKTPLLITAAFGSLLLASVAGAASIAYSVPSASFSTIQAAVNAANDPANDYTITVAPGQYRESVRIENKSKITLQGRETARTFLTGSGSSAAVQILSSTVISVKHFTFENGTIGISVSGSSSPDIDIKNNVFVIGTASGLKGIEVLSPATAKIYNNTFYQNDVAIRRETEATEIINNIFANNDANVIQTVADNNIRFNSFHPLSSGVTGTEYIPNTVVLSANPLFVNAAGRNFHLTAASPCIDTGSSSINDRTPPAPAANRSDIGAYGGLEMDTIPFPVTGVVSSATSTTSVSITWSDSADYRVSGYRVHYGSSPGTYTGTGAIEGASPIDVGTVTSYVLSGLTGSAGTPATPVLNTPEPRDGALLLSWSAVSGATGYKLYYGTVTVTENTLSVGTTTSYRLTGLVNGQTYLIGVSAVSQPAVYVAVTAYNATAGRDPGTAYESVYTERTALIGTAVESGLSEKSGIPEPLSAYPDLPDTGCFIATAAYGSIDAPAVRMLREFRDRRLLTNAAGRAFVRWYYRTSPHAVRYLDAHPTLKPLVRGTLQPVVAFAVVLTYAPWVLALAAGTSFILLRRRMFRRNA